MIFCITLNHDQMRWYTSLDPALEVQVYCTPTSQSHMLHRRTFRNICEVKILSIQGIVEDVCKSNVVSLKRIKSVDDRPEFNRIKIKYSERNAIDVSILRTRNQTLYRCNWLCTAASIHNLNLLDVLHRKKIQRGVIISIEGLILKF